MCVGPNENSAAAAAGWGIKTAALLSIYIKSKNTRAWERGTREYDTPNVCCIGWCMRLTPHPNKRTLSRNFFMRRAGEAVKKPKPNIWQRTVSNSIFFFKMMIKFTTLLVIYFCHPTSSVYIKKELRENATKIK